jgi:hypothetical protein
MFKCDIEYGLFSENTDGAYSPSKTIWEEQRGT